MTSLRRLSAALALSVAALAAPALASGDAPAWASSDETIILSYTPSDAAARDPALALTLTERFLADAAAARQAAEADRKGRGSPPESRFRPHRFARSETSFAARAPDSARPFISVISETLVEDARDDRRAALQATLWDAKTGRAVAWPALFGATSVPGPIRAAWRDAVMTAFWAEGGGWPEGALEAAEARLAETPLTLAPSSIPGKAAGVVFHHGPETFGPEAGGPSRILLPLSAIAAYLSPEYAPYFEGAPGRGG